MLLSELFLIESSQQENLFEAKVAWAKQGGRLVRKWRCTSGPRQGRIVNAPVDCGKPIDPRRHQRFKVIRKRQAKKAAALSKVTKRHNPVSRVVRHMNKHERTR